MIGMDRIRNGARLALATALIAATLGPATAVAQSTRGARTAPAKGQATSADPKTRLSAGGQESIRFEETAVPVNATDPIAIVNREVITRQQLADEAVARKGQEILDTLIARRLIEQALRARKMEVTAAEIDAEIDETAMRVAGVGREAWLRTLDKERKISPAQYARDIIYPAIALRKLAKDRVQVTAQDMTDAFEAHFGERLHCRIIMVDRQRTAMEIWEKLKDNPAGFEKVAKDQSTDTATRALGGLLTEPITRHAFPRTVSDSAFAQLVDGDAKDTDPTHKPKNGDVSGPIQINEMAWVIVKREGLDPARKVDRNDPAIVASLKGQMFDAKLQEAMKDAFTDLMKAAEVDNRLTGAVKLANEQDHPDHQTDREVKLMGAEGQNTLPSATSPRSTSPNAPAGTPAASGRTSTPPTGVSPDVANTAEGLRKTLAKPR